MARLKTPVSENEHRLGKANAPIILVEYGDYQCPHCRRAHPFIKRLLKERGSDICFVFRNFPLSEIHPYAHSAAMAAEAAGKQGKFWQMHDLIFENQEKLNTEFLIELAVKLGLNIEQFARDITSKDIQEKIEKDFESGIRSGVNGTPTFFLNGSPILTYDETYASLADAIQLELEVK